MLRKKNESHSPSYTLDSSYLEERFKRSNLCDIFTRINHRENRPKR